LSQQINLYNEAFRKQKKPFSALAMAQALGFIAIGTLVVAGYTGYRVRALAALDAQAQRQLEGQQAQLALLAKEQGQGRNGSLADELVRLESQAKTRRDLLSSLRTGALGNVEGFSRYLAAFARQRTDGVWLTGLAIGGDENELQVRGRVLRPELVPAYLRALNNEDVMRGRSVTELSLNAVQEPRANVTPGQPGVRPGTEQAPLRFVEFSLRAPRRPEEPAKPEAEQKKKAAS